jgi:hypothetical protein
MTTRKPTEAGKRASQQKITGGYAKRITITVSQGDFGVKGRWRETIEPTLKANVFAGPMCDSKQQFLGCGGVILLGHSVSEDGAPGKTRSPERSSSQGSWVTGG